MATTHTDYVIFLAFPRQQWLRERPSTLCLPVLLHVTVESLHNLYIVSISPVLHTQYFGWSEKGHS